MKYALLTLVLGCSFSLHAQIKLEKLWETDTVIAIPESVYPDLKNKILYVSLIDGPGWAVDGKGGVGKMSPDGKQFDSTWITGLNAPKGIGIRRGKMLVADVTEIVVIDIASGSITKKISPPGALNLNDVTVSESGIAYISDSKAGNVWKLEGDEPELYLTQQPGVNGVKAVGSDLYIAAGKNFQKVDAQKKITPIATLPQGGDGVEPVGNGDFIVTAWVGYIFYVHANGKVETLLETHQQKKNTADIGYDPATQTLWVPTFNGKTVAAYRVVR
ncbi:MAG: ATP-binding protein [Candidatus Pseudobacter hemicellulosilyticus]|uniref:ATP-binding protein n=1 Tax=Candidatus Pseudobacter hemicellulosilyticus TaxID=3121375 RepID=A0AAJ5WQ59_9BACT|nr:MAG: ATP-binding protein [Pseudobacter sp.]